MDEQQDASQSTDPWRTPCNYLIVLLVPAAYCLLYFWSTGPGSIEDGVRLHEAGAELPYADPISPLPTVVTVDVRKADLGERLFFFSRLSGSDDTSCASCHDLSEGGDDGRQTSIGTLGRKGALNAPTVFNAGYNLAQFWDGRSPTLESQIDEPIAHPFEMASSWPEIIEKLSADKAYLESFQALYADGITADNIKNAIATFERTLITPNARFDQFLQGSRDALSDKEKEGYRLFSSLGCISCHQGRNIGGNIYQKFGLIRPFFDESNDRREDLGRFNVTGVEADRHVFKVPSLRNVALTAPYFHDGSIDTLETAVALMAYHQLGRVLTPREIDLIVAFLKTLTGDMPS